MKAAFDGFVLDREARRLTCEGRNVHLSPKAFDLLVLLVEARPAVVDKAAIRARLWPGVHVVDASLTNLVTEIRGELGPGLGTRIVRTVHGVGYGFGGEVQETGAAPRDDDSSAWLVLRDRRIALRTGDNSIGREAGAVVWVDAESVSRRHAVIRVPPPGAVEPVTIEDLGSTNGTHVGGRRITTVTPLEDGQRVRVGQVSFHLRLRPVDAPTKRVGKARR